MTDEEIKAWYEKQLFKVDLRELLRDWAYRVMAEEWYMPLPPLERVKRVTYTPISHQLPERT